MRWVRTNLVFIIALVGLAVTVIAAASGSGDGGPK